MDFLESFLAVITALGALWGAERYRVAQVRKNGSGGKHDRRSVVVTSLGSNPHVLTEKDRDFIRGVLREALTEAVRTGNTDLASKLGDLVRSVGDLVRAEGERTRDRIDDRIDRIRGGAA